MIEANVLETIEANVKKAAAEEAVKKAAAEEAVKKAAAKEAAKKAAVRSAALTSRLNKEPDDNGANKGGSIKSHKKRQTRRHQRKARKPTKKQ